MPDISTNLLPRKRRASIRNQYFLRLAVVALLFIALLALIAGVLLVPTYVLLTGNAKSKEAQIASLTKTIASQNEAGVAARLATLTGHITALATLDDVPTASEVMRRALAIPHPGVLLTSFTYLPAVNGAATSTSRAKGASAKKPGTLTISGTARTRDALRTYQLALENTGGIASADLPVSAFAQNADSGFTITLTLAP